jgi:hypothetical protein
MLTVKSAKNIGFENGKSIEVVELYLDTASDLPVADGGIEVMLLAQGSIAWDIATGDFYGLNSSGSWVKQNGGD